jgi:hypothetical protein
MSASNAEYYRSRAEQELERAQQSTAPKVVAAHYALAELYLERLAAERSASRGGDSSTETGKVAPDTDGP